MPAPRFRSSPIVSPLTGAEISALGAVQADAQDRARQLMLASIASRPAPTRADEAGHQPGSAGLSCSAAELVARAISLGLALPPPDRPELLRAWAHEYASDLIDPTAEQHVEAVANWRWW